MNEKAPGAKRAINSILGGAVAVTAGDFLPGGNRNGTKTKSYASRSTRRSVRQDKKRARRKNRT